MITSQSENPSDRTAMIEVKTTEQKTKAPKKLSLRAVFGDLVHPYSKPEIRFKTNTINQCEEDAWVKGQIDAGKLVIVE